MSTTRHVGTIHVDAPVQTVFDYVKDPVHFYSAMPDSMHARLRAVNVTPEGVGTTYEWLAGHLAGFELVGVITRQECADNERIVDSSSTGPVWTWKFEPDGDGTTLTLAFEYSTKIPLMDKVIDAIGWRGDRDIDAILATVKGEVEA
jgi:ligand-binding SRPBCC domain-containing protein